MTREESIKIYQLYSRKLFNVSFRIVGDSALAEEIAQDTVLKFITVGERSFATPFGRLRAPLRMTWEDRRIGAWLTKTCVRASIDALRKMRREREFLEEYAGVGIEEESGPDVEEKSLTVELVKTAIGTLPEQYRLILDLVLIEGLDYEEISEVTGERQGALRTRYSRARKMLAERLNEIRKEYE